MMAWTWVVILGLWKDSGATEEGKSIESSDGLSVRVKVTEKEVKKSS